MEAKKQTLIQDLSRELVAAGSDVPRLLAAYAGGEHISGRPLWNSPVELTLIVDIDSTGSRFGGGTLSPADFNQIKDRVERSGYRFSYRMCTLVKDQEGKIAFNRERFQPTVFYYRAAQSVVQGVRVYAAPDFLLEDFERDIQHWWEGPGGIRSESAQRIGNLFDSFGFLPVDDEQLLYAYAVDVLLLGELLAAMQVALHNSADVVHMAPFDILRDQNTRARLAATWLRAAGVIADASRHLIGRQTRFAPCNYTQLIDRVADLGVIRYEDVEYLSLICERSRGLFPSNQQTITSEAADALARYLDSLGSLEHFQYGLCGYIHSLVSAA